MKKLCFFLLSLICVPGLAFGKIAVESMSMPYPGPGPVVSDTSLDTLVVFDGEQQATVAGELELAGVAGELEAVSMVIPGSNVRFLKAFYRFTSETDQPDAKCDEQKEYTYDQTTQKDVVKRVYYTCLGLLEAKTSRAADGLTVTLDLPLPLAIGETATLTFAYKADGYTKPASLVTNFTYATPRLPFDLATVRVRVDVIESLFLKGGTSETDYASEGSLVDGIIGATLQSFEPKYGASFEHRYADSSAFVKTTQNLDPNESFSVSGTYATSWLALSWWQFLLAILGLLALVGLIIWGERHAARGQAK